MPVSCEPSDLVSEAVCLSDAVGYGPQLAIKTYLLCQWAECPLPPAPTALAAQNIGDTHFRAFWTLVPGNGYQLFVSLDPNFGSFLPGYNPFPVGGQGNTDIFIAGLDPDTVYYYKVRAYNDCGVSTDSNVISVTTTGAGVGVVIADGSGGFWGLIVDGAGNLGTATAAGPASPSIVLDDGGGGFWLVEVDALGNRGASPTAGPATTVPVLSDGVGGLWDVIVDTNGNLGTKPH